MLLTRVLLTVGVSLETKRMVRTMLMLLLSDGYLSLR